MISLELILLPNLARAINDFFEKFNFKLEEYNPEYFFSNLLNLDTYVLFFTTINPWNAAGWFAIGYTLFFQFFELINPSEKKTYEKQDGYGSHGTARWQTLNEKKKYYYKNDKQGWFLGHIKEQSYDLDGDYAYHTVNNSTDLNMQVNVIGPPGSKKTTGFLYPSIFEMVKNYKDSKEKPDFVITDPKSEILMYTTKYLEKNGWEVRVLDFIHLRYGDQLNPIDFITEEKELMQIAEGFISASNAAKQKGKASGGKDPIWDNGEMLLLSALIGFVLQVYPDNEQTFETISNLLVQDEVKDPKKAKYFFANNDIGGAALDLWNKFLLIEDKLRSGIVGGLAIKLTLFSIEGIKKITAKTTVDIRKLGVKKEKPIALFILMPDSDQTFSPVINTVITMTFKQLYKTAYKYNNKLQVPVFFLIEEIANIGKISDLEEMLGTMRGRRIYPMMIWQDLAQMKKLYGDVWEGMLAKCDTLVVLGVNDEFTADKISKTLGQTTIKIQGNSQKSGSGIMTAPGKSQSQNFQGRSLLFPNEIRTFPNDETIIIQRARQPLTLYKVQYEYWKKVIAEPVNLDKFTSYSEARSVRGKQVADTEKVEAEDNVKKSSINSKKFVVPELDVAKPKEKEITTEMEVAVVKEINDENETAHNEIIESDFYEEGEVIEVEGDYYEVESLEQDIDNDVNIFDGLNLMSKDEDVLENVENDHEEEDIIMPNSNELDRLVSEKNQW